MKTIEDVQQSEARPGATLQARSAFGRWRSSKSMAMRMQEMIARSTVRGWAWRGVSHEGWAGWLAH
jgi:hypothetical protein